MYVCDVSLSLYVYIYIHLYHTCICTYCTCTHSVHVNILKICVFLVTCHLVQTWRSKNKERWNFRLASTSVWPSLLWKKHLVGANVQVILLAWLACLFGLEVQHEAKTRHWVFEAEWVRLRLTWSLEKTAQVVSSLCCQSRGCWVERWSSFISNPLSEYWTRPSPENLYVLSSSDPYWVRIAAIPRNCLFLVMVNIFLNIISTSILNAAPDLTFHGFLDFLKICKYMIVYVVWSGCCILGYLGSCCSPIFPFVLVREILHNLLCEAWQAFVESFLKSDSCGVSQDFKRGRAALYRAIFVCIVVVLHSVPHKFYRPWSSQK